MTDIKQQLANLIDAYADAKRSGNETLVKLASTPLQDFFTSYEIIPIPTAPQKAQDEEVPDEE